MATTPKPWRLTSRDGKNILTSSRDNKAAIWDAEGRYMILQLPGHEDSILATAFSPDGTRVVTSSDDDKERIWDANTGVSIFTLTRALGGGEAPQPAAEAPFDGAGILRGAALEAGVAFVELGAQPLALEFEHGQFLFPPRARGG